MNSAARQPDGDPRSAAERRASDIPQRRRELLARRFPGDVPRLWCPTLTHFRAAGELDEERIQRHLQHLAPHLGGILVPGSTGEGWEMSDDEIRRLLSVVSGSARRFGLHVLIGVLNRSLDGMLRCIGETVHWLQSHTVSATAEEAFARTSVVGFTVCPPTGGDLAQATIHEALAAVLSLGWPTALYQLPQVTLNEMTPDTVQQLAERYPNFFLLKDTSGQDRVAAANRDLGGVFLVRGAEGDYARVLRERGGCYDGLLLSTANVFASQLHEMIHWLEQGRSAEAESVARRFEPVVHETFQLVADFDTGNPFTNANKVLDHVMAYGPAAVQHPPPLLYSGVRLPARYIEASLERLRANGLLPAAGYLDS